jgi:hypothetical protein
MMGSRELSRVCSTEGLHVEVLTSSEKVIGLRELRVVRINIHTLYAASFEMSDSS